MSVGLGGSPAASNQILFYSFFSWFPALGEGKKKKKKKEDGTVPAPKSIPDSCRRGIRLGNPNPRFPSILQ